MKKIANFIYTFFFISLSIMVSSCNYDSDEEIRDQINDLSISITKSREKVDEQDKYVKDHEQMHSVLGENNKYLEKEMKEKKQETLNVLKEIYEDAKRYSTTYPANCNICNKKVTISYSKFYELASRYNTGWTKTDTRTWREETTYNWYWFFGIHKYNFQTRTYDHKTKTEFDFHKCPDCMTEADIRRMQASLYENRDKIAKLEAEMVKKRLNLVKNQALLQEQTKSSTVLQRALVSKDKHRKEKAQEKEEKLEAQRIAAEKEAENERLKKENEERDKERDKEQEELKKNHKAQVLNMAKTMLQLGMSIEQIVQATSLSHKEIEQIK